MRDDGAIRSVGRVGSVGLELGLCVVFGMVGGSSLDGWLGTEPFGTLIGFALGATAGFRALFRAVRRLEEESERIARAPVGPISGRRRGGGDRC